MNRNIKTLIFDADDTLWDCQSHFDAVEKIMHQKVSRWCSPEEAHKALIATETRNIALTGFGCKAFTLSLLETAISCSNGEIAANDIEELIRHGYSLLHMPATPLPGVRETLEKLSIFQLVVFTKGDIQDQARKLERSGLRHFFSHVEITADKSEEDYRRLCQKLDILPHEAVMVGNSFKSDIAPALAIGMKAIYIPFHVAWQLEHAEEYHHEDLIKLTEFSELMSIIL